jgi:hypothetical protein
MREGHPETRLGVRIVLQAVWPWGETEHSQLLEITASRQGWQGARLQVTGQ